MLKVGDYVRLKTEQELIDTGWYFVEKRGYFHRDSEFIFQICDLCYCGKTYYIHRILNDWYFLQDTSVFQFCEVGNFFTVGMFAEKVENK